MRGERERADWMEYDRMEYDRMENDRMENDWMENDWMENDWMENVARCLYTLPGNPLATRTADRKTSASPCG
jgi:hypothetical protein